MVEGRVLDERLIRMRRQGEGYFWIGGPGEEAFNTCLGPSMDKGQGLDHDYLHGHYRSSATLLALGAPSIDALRQRHEQLGPPQERRGEQRRERRERERAAGNGRAAGVTDPGFGSRSTRLKSYRSATAEAPGEPPS